MFKPLRNYRVFRRAQHIVLTVRRYGFFGDLIRQSNLPPILKLKKVPAPEPTGAQARSARLRAMLEELGPTFIKLGQILSTRPDLLPGDITSELAMLQDHVTPVGWDRMEPECRRCLGEHYQAFFSEFNTEPIASASIAQVYEARLRSGEKVAVKIVRPGTEARFAEDLAVLEFLGNLMEAHVEEARHWNVRRIVGQLRRSVQHELDLKHEGRNADIIRANFAKNKTIYVPKIYWEHTSRSVLIMEFVEGRPLAEFFDGRADPETRQELASRGANVILKQIFEDGFFQADPHPGNVLVLGDNVICFLDFGMFGRLDRDSVAILSRILHASANKDVERLLKAARDLRVLPEDLNEGELRIALLDLLEQYHGLPLKQIDVPKLLGDIVDLISRYNIGVRYDFFFLIKALSTLESTGRHLCPDFDMIAHIEPFIRSMMLRHYSPGHLWETSQRVTEDLARLGRESPEHVLEILRQVRNGRLKIEFHHKGLDQPLKELNQVSDKINLGLIVAGLTIASSLMAQAGIGPKVLKIPLIGGLGFLLAFLAGFWIILDILRNRRR